MKLKKLLCATLSLVLLLALCACGEKTPAPTDPTTTTPADATTDSDLAYIKDNGELIIGYTVVEPMNFTDKEGKFVGFDTQLAEAVCAKLGVTPKFVEITWETKEVELKSKNIDCIWNGMTIDPERMEQMEISQPYAKNEQVVVMKKGADYKDTSSLIGKNIAAEIGSAGESVVKEEENLKQATLVGKSVQTDCLMEVKAGTADAAVLDSTLVNAAVGEGTDYADLALVGRLNAIENYGVGFRKGSDACEAVNKILDELTADGTMAKLAEQYGLELAK
ncbi:MAG: transporter substrate-binding domain-containing protein [Evtepia sp.]